MPTNWDRYLKCSVCAAYDTEPCFDLRTSPAIVFFYPGRTFYKKKPHKGRRKR